MSSIIYGLCAAVALLCAWLLLSAWRRQRHRLLLWSGLCFAGFTLNNVLLILDKLVLPDVDLSLWRISVAVISVGAHNDYGHPRADTLAALHARAGLVVYRTDESGRIVLESDGRSLTIRTDR